MSRRPLKPDEKRAWARVAKTVRPKAGQMPPEMPPPDGLPAMDMPLAPDHPKPTLKHPAFHPFITPHTPLKPTTAPIPDRGKERRVRRGQAPISATLDLHGHTQASAQGLLISFLTRQRGLGAECVLVITGKGRMSEGVLRARLLEWLGTSQARTLVSGYASAHQKHGGSGAWYIFLRK